VGESSPLGRGSLVRPAHTERFSSRTYISVPCSFTPVDSLLQDVASTLGERTLLGDPLARRDCLATHAKAWLCAADAPLALEGPSPCHGELNEPRWMGTGNEPKATKSRSSCSFHAPSTTATDCQDDDRHDVTRTMSAAPLQPTSFDLPNGLDDSPSTETSTTSTAPTTSAKATADASTSNASSSQGAAPESASIPLKSDRKAQLVMGPPLGSNPNETVHEGPELVENEEILAELSNEVEDLDLTHLRLRTLRGLGLERFKVVQVSTRMACGMCLS
jgi:hypothetical protein